MLTVEELMKPRWKVIADYPKSLYHVGDILNGGWRSEDLIYCDHDGPRWRQYPHLFRKLEWWEERTADQLPEYIKHGENGLPRKVDKIIGDVVLFEGGRTRKINSHWLPITEAEYLTYKSTQL